jgi:hypothetical protein
MSLNKLAGMLANYDYQHDGIFHDQEQKRRAIASGIAGVVRWSTSAEGLEFWEFLHEYFTAELTEDPPIISEVDADWYKAQLHNLYVDGHDAEDRAFSHTANLINETIYWDNTCSGWWFWSYVCVRITEYEQADT